MTEKDYLKLLESWDCFEIILHHLDSDQSFLPSFIEFALYHKDVNSWRALYIIDKLYDKHPDWIEPYLPKMVERLKTENHHGKKRHLLKLISQSEVQPEYSGFLVDYCLNVFTSEEPVANRVHAMQVLYNISDTEPELKPELLDIIQQEIEFRPTPGIRARGSKLAKKLFLQINSHES